ncbi:MAG TPA: glutaredoxin family protein [Thermomicrobiales bacterium]|nr:glutaredoxin family protein [Thermomicrobiales bacterium]
MLARIRSVLVGRELDVTLMSKPGCELCNKAERVARRVFGARRVRVVNILEDRALEDTYVFRIPVPIVDGVEIAEGLITEDDARRARAAALRGRVAR